jgi:hypothetical protein
LQNINQYIRESAASRIQVIVTCSALKETYRDILLHGIAEMACADDGQETLSICFVALLNEDKNYALLWTADNQQIAHRSRIGFLPPKAGTAGLLVRHV